MNSRRRGEGFLTRLACVVLLAVMLFGLTSCFLLGGEERLISNTEINENGELIVYYADGSSQNAGKIENNETNIVVEGSGGDVSSATAKGLMSAVSITSNFVSRTHTYYPGFGIVGGSGNKYYSRGSGVICRLEGDEALIITNHHVVYDSGSKTSDGISDDIYVYLYGRENEEYAISAEYVGGSAYYDIAVLYAKDSAFASGVVKAAEFSSEEVSVGETAIAVGNPQGYGISASLGIVSVDSEYIVTSGMTSSTRVIRVDTPVNSGNSGGGLYNDKGEIIGIVNAKIVDESVENIGYAIPAAVVKAVSENIIENCLNKDTTSVKRALLGITLSSNNACTVIGEDGNIDIVETVTVASVEKGSICDGIVLAGDILVGAEIGTRTLEISRSHHIIDFMLYARVGDTVTLKIKRSGEIMTKSVTVTESAVISY